MPGATTNHSLPYPVDADSINVPRDIKALADAVDVYTLPASVGPQASVATDARFGNAVTDGDQGFIAAVGGELYVSATDRAQVFVDGILRISASSDGITSLATTTSGQFVALHPNALFEAVGCAVHANMEPKDPFWSSANILAYKAGSGAGSNSHPRYCLYADGLTVQMRMIASSGPRIDFIGWDSSAYAPIGAAAFDVASSITTKRDVASLRDGFVPTASSHDPTLDTVPVVDVLALRPVTFRPLLDPQRIVATGDEIDAKDDTSWTTAPVDGILGAEGTRERLGLIAEEVESVIPSAVSHDANGDAIGIDYAQITVALLNHVQQLTERIAVLEGGTP